MKNLVIFLGIIIIILIGVFVYMSNTVNAPVDVVPAEVVSPKAPEKENESPLPELSAEDEAVTNPPVKNIRQISDSELITCIDDAKGCPDGSVVGRTGPNCEFASCPSEIESKNIVCTDETRSFDTCAEIYQPVCGLVQSDCITESCNPLPETFSNSCFACTQGNTISYTEGECLLEVS